MISVKHVPFFEIVKSGWNLNTARNGRRIQRVQPNFVSEASINFRLHIWSPIDWV